MSQGIEREMGAKRGSPTNPSQGNQPWPPPSAILTLQHAALVRKVDRGVEESPARNRQPLLNRKRPRGSGTISSRRGVDRIAIVIGRRCDAASADRHGAAVPHGGPGNAGARTLAGIAGSSLARPHSKPVTGTFSALVVGQSSPRRPVLNHCVGGCCRERPSRDISVFGRNRIREQSVLKNCYTYLMLASAEAIGLTQMAMSIGRRG